MDHLGQIIINKYYTIYYILYIITSLSGYLGKKKFFGLLCDRKKESKIEFSKAFHCKQGRHFFQ